MTDRSDEIASAAAESEGTAHSGLLPQIRMIAQALWASPVGKTLASLALAVLLVIMATAYGQIILNRWYKPFYDALSRRDFADFLRQLGIFAAIACGLLVLNVAQKWLGEMLKLKLREGLVRDLVRDWMQPRRAFWLANAGPMGVNPDQRIHEDARHLCELSADLGIGLLQASILLISFVGVLWVISAGFVIRLGGHDYGIPGYMVWAAILYSATGSLLSYWVGRNLVGRNAERYAREADLRFSLVRINEHLDGIALADGEADERRRVEMNLQSVLAATRRLVTGLTSLTWVTAGFGWTTIIAPILVAAPLYFAGTISFGGLMMAAGAFTQAQSSLRWFIDNFSTIAEWRATLLRVANFRRAVLTTDALRRLESRIEYAEGPPGRITIEGLEIVSRSGTDYLRERKAEVRAGERVLILCESGTSKTTLFRALAGLWPGGRGRILRPTGEQILYIPRGTPYLPRATLREVLAYPLKVENFAQDRFAAAIRRMGLQHLVPLLDVSRRWDRELTADEQISLAFARMLLYAPPWVLIDNTFGSLDDDTLERIVDIFENELKHTSVIHIGSSQAHDPLFSRVIHLDRAKAVRPRSSSHPGAPGEESQRKSLLSA